MQDRRWHLIDALRGLALLNMLGMHALYDVHVVFGREPAWALRPEVHIWQQYICWSFILIAGFSYAWGRKHNLRRGLLLNLFGFAITAVTLLFVPEETIWFGILNFMGCAILLTLALERGLNRLPDAAGLALSAALFWFFRRVEVGQLRFGLRLPQFRSSDYFPLLPWLLLFWCGFYLKRLVDRSPACIRALRVKIPLLSFIGRYTLPVYLLHQPLLMGLCLLLIRN